MINATMTEPRTPRIMEGRQRRFICDAAAFVGQSVFLLVMAVVLIEISLIHWAALSPVRSYLVSGPSER
ncbi:MAG TPA: hypothetical protein VG734_22995 [Lacunisphaera sp.]|nr:hypothetical protein [Lacunisphaera sp.]